MLKKDWKFYIFCIKFIIPFEVLPSTLSFLSIYYLHALVLYSCTLSSFFFTFFIPFFLSSFHPSLDTFSSFLPFIFFHPFDPFQPCFHPFFYVNHSLYSFIQNFWFSFLSFLLFPFGPFFLYFTYSPVSFYLFLILYFLHRPSQFIVSLQDAAGHFNPLNEDDSGDEDDIQYVWDIGIIKTPGDFPAIIHWKNRLGSHIQQRNN